MTLLNDANIPQSTLTNAKSDLIKIEELKKEHEASMGKKFKVSAIQITEFRDIHNNLLRVMRHIAIPHSDTEEERQR